jgi:heme/copper-type cytochrome/quinol oxidase subunit 2
MSDAQRDAFHAYQREHAMRTYFFIALGTCLGLILLTLVALGDAGRDPNTFREATANEYGLAFLLILLMVTVFPISVILIPIFYIAWVSAARKRENRTAEMHVTETETSDAQPLEQDPTNAQRVDP